MSKIFGANVSHLYRGNRTKKKEVAKIPAKVEEVAVIAEPVLESKPNKKEKKRLPYGIKEEAPSPEE
jgi:hypothetical protein